MFFRGIELDKFSEKFWTRPLFADNHPAFESWSSNVLAHFNSVTELRQLQAETWARVCPDLDEVRISRLETPQHLIRCTFALLDTDERLLDYVTREELKIKWIQLQRQNPGVPKVLFFSLLQDPQLYVVCFQLHVAFHLPLCLVEIVKDYNHVWQANKTLHVATFLEWCNP